MMSCSPCELEKLRFDACIYACASQEINFRLPEGVEAEDIADLHLTIAISNRADAVGIAAGDMSQTPSNFDVAQLKILLDPCDLCVAGGYYYYELLATLTDDRLVPIQNGILTVIANLRKVVL